MRIVSWNMGCAWERSRYRASHDDAWEFLLIRLKPDIALLQETLERRVISEGYEEPLWTPAFPDGDCGSVILSRVGKLTLTETNLAWDDHRTQVAHGVLAGIGNVCVSNVHARTNGPMFPRLRRTIETVNDQRGQRFIVGGDFNTGRSHPVSPEWTDHSKFWGDIDGEWGFREPLPFGRGERQSYWAHWAKNDRPTEGNSMQDDHVLLDAKTFGANPECLVWDTKEVRGLSDHGPIVVDLDLTRSD